VTSGTTISINGLENRLRSEVLAFGASAGTTGAAGFAGGSAFSEIVDVESIRQLRDPVREEALRILNNQGEAA